MMNSPGVTLSCPAARARIFSVMVIPVIRRPLPACRWRRAGRG
jgi:hypothetical protein